MNMKKLESTLRMLLRDAQTHERMIREALAYVRAGADAGAGAGTPARGVNTQNSNNNPTVKNKQTKTCVCVVTGDGTTGNTENTHTQVLSLDFVQSNLPEGIPAWYAAYWFEQMTRRGWCLKDGKSITAANWQYFLGVFFSHATDEELAAAQKYGKESPQPTEDLAALRDRLLAENERMWA